MSARLPEKVTQAVSSSLSLIYQLQNGWAGLIILCLHSHCQSVLLQTHFRSIKHYFMSNKSDILASHSSSTALRPCLLSRASRGHFTVSPPSPFKLIQNFGKACSTAYLEWHNSYCWRGSCFWMHPCCLKYMHTPYIWKVSSLGGKVPPPC